MRRVALGQVHRWAKSQEEAISCPAVLLRQSLQHRITKDLKAPGKRQLSQSWILKLLLYLILKSQEKTPILHRTRQFSKTWILKSPLYLILKSQEKTPILHRTSNQNQEINLQMAHLKLILWTPKVPMTRQLLNAKLSKKTRKSKGMNSHLRNLRRLGFNKAKWHLKRGLKHWLNRQFRKS